MQPELPLIHTWLCSNWPQVEEAFAKTGEASFPFRDHELTGDLAE